MTHFIAGRYPDRIGWLVGPYAAVSGKTKLREWMPYAMDNDAYSAWTNKTPWNEAQWMEMLEWSEDSGYEPLWSLVPDVVADKDATLEKWSRYSSVVKSKGFVTAFAVQDGMIASDVPSDAEVIFVGGTKAWKWNTVEMWAKSFPRVHVGRVNGKKNLWICENLGVESVDGTDWFRDESDPCKMPVVMEWLKTATTKAVPEMEIAP